MYFPRFHGKVAVVRGKRGRSCEVAIREDGKLKTLAVNPVHLKKVS
jgi:ribosomal protein L21E